MTVTDFPEYRIRRVDFVGVEEVGRWSIKLYTIDAHAAVRPAALFATARARIPEMLPADMAEGRVHPEAFDLPITDTLVACTWELAVVQHERDAWVRHVQARGPGADVPAYRHDVLDAVDV